MAENPHVLSVGIDLAPALESQGYDPEEVVSAVAEACLAGGGQAPVPAMASRAIKSVGRLLNIAWVEASIDNPASIICPRSTACPRPDPCEKLPARRQAADISEIRAEILAET